MPIPYFLLMSYCTYYYLLLTYLLLTYLLHFVEAVFVLRMTYTIIVLGFFCWLRRRQAASEVVSQLASWLARLQAGGE